MSFTIAAGQTSSNSLDTTEACPGLAVQLPATAVGTSFAVHGLVSGSTYAQIYNDGVALSIPFTANSVHVISPVKLRFGAETTGSTHTMKAGISGTKVWERA